MEITAIVCKIILSTIMFIFTLAVVSTSRV